MIDVKQIRNLHRDPDIMELVDSLRDLGLSRRDIEPILGVPGIGPFQVNQLVRLSNHAARLRKHFKPHPNWFMFLSNTKNFNKRV